MGQKVDELVFLALLCTNLRDIRHADHHPGITMFVHDEGQKMRNDQVPVVQLASRNDFLSTFDQHF